MTSADKYVHFVLVGQFTCTLHNLMWLLVGIIDSHLLNQQVHFNFGFFLTIIELQSRPIIVVYIIIK